MEEVKRKVFDTVVTYRDAQTGLVTSQNPYILRVVGSGEGGRTRYYERPKGSGNLFNAKGEAVGRWVEGKFQKGAEHVAYVPPKSEKEQLAEALAAKELALAAREAEIAELKKLAGQKTESGKGK